MTIEELHELWDKKESVYSKRKHSDPEHDLQVQCVRWFNLQYPNIKIWATPSGGKRDLVTASRLKAEGVIRGVPDLSILAARHGKHMMWVEMKNGKKGRVSPEQKEMIDTLNNEGHHAVVCRTFEEFVKEVNEYLN